MIEKRKEHVDYAYIKNQVSITMILGHYGLLRAIKGTGNVVRSTCPIHDGSNDKQFVVNIKNNTWYCFGDCRRGGSTLELVAGIERIDIHEAAVRIVSWFALQSPHKAQRKRSTVMSENQRPSHKAFVVEDRGEGEDADAFWTRIGSAWPHKDGKGLNVVLSALPANGRLVLREFTEEDAKVEEAKPAKRAGNARR
jgi:hypothetical protein